VKTFKTWKLTFTAELVSHYPIDGVSPGCIHENLVKALRKDAGAIGYLFANEETRIDQENEKWKT
jgi:hypothetical protein